MRCHGEAGLQPRAGPHSVLSVQGLQARRELPGHSPSLGGSGAAPGPGGGSACRLQSPPPGPEPQRPGRPHGWQWVWAGQAEPVTQAVLQRLQEKGWPPGQREAPPGQLLTAGTRSAAPRARLGLGPRAAACAACGRRGHVGVHLPMAPGCPEAPGTEIQGHPLASFRHLWSLLLPVNQIQ